MRGAGAGLIIVALIAVALVGIALTLDLDPRGAGLLGREAGLPASNLALAAPAARSLPRGSLMVARAAAGLIRVTAASRLITYPPAVLVKPSQATTPHPPHLPLPLLVLLIVCCAGAISLTLLLVGVRWRQRDRWWRQRESVALARAELAEAAHARVLAEAEQAHEREQIAGAANHARSDFLGMISHEIRTPLHTVLRLAGALLDAPTVPGAAERSDAPLQHREAAKTMRDSGDSLLHILDDILDYSRLDAEGLRFDATPFSPVALTQNAISALQPGAGAKGLAIVADFDPALPGGLQGDAGRIRQVLLAVLANVVRHADTGTVTIHVGCPACADDAATIEWSVQDTRTGTTPGTTPGSGTGSGTGSSTRNGAGGGIGNEAGNQSGSNVGIGSVAGIGNGTDAGAGPNIGTGDPMSLPGGGSSLGLALGKRLIEQMGGAMGSVSTIGGETAVRVRLTLPVAESPARTESAMASPPGDAGAAEVTSAFDADALHQLGMDIGHDGVAEMLEVFQRETRVRLQRMSAPGFPLASLMREAHSLKGAAGTVCAPLLRRRAEAMEARLRAGVPIEAADLAALGAAWEAYTEEVEAAGIVSVAV